MLQQLPQPESKPDIDRYFDSEKVASTEAGSDN
jgi:hypothetical protein